MTTCNNVRCGLSGMGRLFACLAMALIGFALAGCRLTQPEGASFASVKIANCSLRQIQDTTMVVFREDGYAAFQPGPGEMVFQREASKMTNLGQNGITASYYGAQTIVRVRAQIVDLGTGSYRLQCKAYFVRNPGDRFLEDEHAMANARRLPYQHLLDKVAKKIKEY
jgi:hypothetical protein